MQRDYAHHGARHLARLDPAEGIGRLAGERAVARLNPGKLPSGGMPVVFDPRVGASLLDGALTVESLLPHAVATPTVSVNPAAAVTIRTQSPLTVTSLAIVVKNRHVPRQDLGHGTEGRRCQWMTAVPSTTST